MSSSSATAAPVVSTEWLQNNLGSVKLLDASWYMAKNVRNIRTEFKDKRIPGAVLFDIDEVSDTSVNLPHMLPSASQFEKQVSAMGISNTDHVVVYDSSGQYVASARAWWLFRTFGHENVSVLEGGLLKWVGEQRALESGELKAGFPPAGSFKATLNAGLLKTLDQIKTNLSTQEFLVIDARSAPRFNGTEAEPRPGLQAGHIPKSVNVPFGTLLQPSAVAGAQQFKSPKEIEEILGQATKGKTQLSTSCGSGVTAAVVNLGFALINKPNIAMYDGSWTEWGAESAGRECEK